MGFPSVSGTQASLGPETLLLVAKREQGGVRRERTPVFLPGSLLVLLSFLSSSASEDAGMTTGMAISYWVIFGSGEVTGQAARAFLRAAAEAKMKAQTS